MILNSAYAVGSQVFVDLWALMGFIPLPCDSSEDVSSVSSVLSVLFREKAAFVVVEDSWFNGLQESLRKRLERSGEPVWIQFPSCESGEMR